MTIIPFPTVPRNYARGHVFEMCEIARADISYGAKVAWIFMDHISNGSAECSLSHIDLAKALNTSERNAARFIKELADNEYIEVHHCRGQSNTYILLSPLDRPSGDDGGSIND